MERTVTIGGKTVTLRASALIPRMYRHEIGRDLMRDMNQLKKAYSASLEAKEKGGAQGEQNDAALTVMDLEIFENVAWVMLKHGARRDESGGWVNGDMAIYSSPDEWLEHLDGVFDVYEVLPVIVELWSLNNHTTSVSAKK